MRPHSQGVWWVHTFGRSKGIFTNTTYQKRWWVWKWSFGREDLDKILPSNNSRTIIKTACTLTRELVLAGRDGRLQLRIISNSPSIWRWPLVTYLSLEMFRKSHHKRVLHSNHSHCILEYISKISSISEIRMIMISTPSFTTTQWQESIIVAVLHVKKLKLRELNSVQNGPLTPPWLLAAIIPSAEPEAYIVVWIHQSTSGYTDASSTWTNLTFMHKWGFTHAHIHELRQTRTSTNTWVHKYIL